MRVREGQAPPLRCIRHGAQERARTSRARRAACRVGATTYKPAQSRASAKLRQQPGVRSAQGPPCRTAATGDPAVDSPLAPKSVFSFGIKKLFFFPRLRKKKRVLSAQVMVSEQVITKRYCVASNHGILRLRSG